jgi:hypothetical protein
VTDSTNISSCLIGLPEFAPLLQIDSQLARRFPLTFKLSRLNIGSTQSPGTLYGFLSQVEKNVEKRNKKRAKKGLPAETIVKGASVSTKNVNNNKNSSASSSADRAKKLQERKEANDKKIQELKEAAAASGKAAKPGSLADKVGMVSRYNEVNDKRK